MATLPTSADEAPRALQQDTGAITGAEAARIMVVLEEAIAGLRALSYLTPELLADEDAIHAVLDKAPASAVLRYGASLRRRSAKDSPGNEDVFAATMAAWRALRRSPGAEARLAALQPRRGDGILAALDALRALAVAERRRLGTTVEAARNAAAQLAEVRAREGRASYERTQLAQKLKLQRIAQARQLNVVRSAESRTAGEVQAQHSAHAAAVSAARELAAAEQRLHDGAFNARREQLEADTTAAASELEALRAAGRTSEAAALKAKRRGEGAVSLAVASFDAVARERHAESREEAAAVAELEAKMQAMRDAVARMRGERLAHEEAADRVRRTHQLQVVSLFMRTRAARVIQAAWREILTARRAAAKATGSKNGKKGKTGK